MQEYLKDAKRQCEVIMTQCHNDCTHGQRGGGERGREKKNKRKREREIGRERGSDSVCVCVCVCVCRGGGGHRVCMCT